MVAVGRAFGNFAQSAGEVGKVESRRVKASGERKQFAHGFLEFGALACQRLAFVCKQPLDASQPDQDAVAQVLLERLPLGVRDAQHSQTRSLDLDGVAARLRLEARGIEGKRRRSGCGSGEPRVRHGVGAVDERDLPRLGRVDTSDLTSVSAGHRSRATLLVEPARSIERVADLEIGVGQRPSQANCQWLARALKRSELDDNGTCSPSCPPPAAAVRAINAEPATATSLSTSNAVSLPAPRAARVQRTASRPAAPAVAASTHLRSAAALLAEAPALTARTAASAAVAGPRDGKREHRGAPPRRRETSRPADDDAGAGSRAEKVQERTPVGDQQQPPRSR